MPNAGSSGARVLLVDDDAVWRLLTASALHERGFEVLDLDSASDIAAQVDACAPDVVILDAMMPDVDGFTACRMLRSQPRYERLPILMMTGLDDEQAISAAYQTGASDFFIKSTHWALLGERLRHLISLSREQSTRDRQDAVARHGADHSVMPFAFGGLRDVLLPAIEVTYDIPGQRFVGLPGAFTGFGLRREATEMSLSVLRGRTRPTQFDRFRQQLLQAVEQRQPFNFELTARPTSRQYRIIRLTLRAAQGEAMQGSLVDITHTWEAQAQIRRLADSDTLTGLASRSQFLSTGAHRLLSAKKREKGAAVVVINVDRFADVNERYGQSSGDELLCLVAARIAQICLPGQIDSLQGIAAEDQPLVSRLAADCFAILFPDIDCPDQLSPLLEQLHYGVAEPFMLTAGSCSITSSIGAALYPAQGDNVGMLLSRADRAMSQVKANGRDGVMWYSTSLEQEVRSRIALVTDLRRAIDSRELELHYQLIVDVSRRQLYGTEALVRWRKTNRLLQPVAFIPLAEETGLIIPIGEWAIGEAARQMAEWQNAGFKLRRMAVNLPSGHFERGTLLEVVVAAIQSSGLQPGVLELELTETALVRDIDRTLPRFQALCEAGAAIAIDDFGTGYSNLTYLARLPVDKLKIDASFVQTMIDSPQAATIVRAIVGLGANLGMTVVAEGVETPEQARTLLGMGCSLMQGFLFSRPTAAEEVVAHSAAALRAIDDVFGTCAAERGASRSLAGEARS